MALLLQSNFIPFVYFLGPTYVESNMCLAGVFIGVGGGKGRKVNTTTVQPEVRPPAGLEAEEVRFFLQVDAVTQRLENGYIEVAHGFEVGRPSGKAHVVQRHVDQGLESDERATIDFALVAKQREAAVACVFGLTYMATEPLTL